MSLSARLKMFIAEKELTQYRVAKNAGIAQQTFASILNGTDARFSNLEKILLAFPELNGDWLLTGRGEMLFPENDGADEIKSETS